MTLLKYVKYVRNNYCFHAANIADTASQVRWENTLQFKSARKYILVFNYLNAIIFSDYYSFILLIYNFIRSCEQVTFLYKKWESVNVFCKRNCCCLYARVYTIQPVWRSQGARSSCRLSARQTTKICRKITVTKTIIFKIKSPIQTEISSIKLPNFNVCRVLLRTVIVNPAVNS